MRDAQLPKKGYYRHFKGGRYELIDFATHSETMETMVVYRALYGERGLWVRPLSMWSERVERDGQVYTRFLPEEEYLRLQAERAPAEAEFIPPPEEAPPEDEGSLPPPEEDWGAGRTAEKQGSAAANSATDGQLSFDLPPSAPASSDKLDILRRVYGYERFREGQAEVIDAILAGRDALAILPTGAGKSLCYQIPAQLLDGVAIVISPLISLMKDQVEALTQAGVSAAYLNSSLSERQFDAAMQRLAQGKYRIVYVAPERLLTPRFLGVTRWLNVSLVAVDEAHCISQWGQDFRPSYLEIPNFIGQLSTRPRVCAFTATATERVRGDVIRLLRLRDPFVKVTGFDRPNLYLSVSRTRDKDAKLLELAESYRGFSGIVYCATRKGVEAACERLLRGGLSGHALPRRAERGRAQAQSGGLPLRPRARHGGDQRLWHGHRQVQRALRDPLQHAQGLGELLSGGRARGPRRGARRLPPALRASGRHDSEVLHRPHGRGGRARTRSAGGGAARGELPPERHDRLLPDRPVPAQDDSALLRRGARRKLRLLR